MVNGLSAQAKPCSVLGEIGLIQRREQLYNKQWIHKSRISVQKSI